MLNKFTYAYQWHSDFKQKIIQTQYYRWASAVGLVVSPLLQTLPFILTGNYGLASHVFLNAYFGIDPLDRLQRSLHIFAHYLPTSLQTVMPYVQRSLDYIGYYRYTAMRLTIDGVGMITHYWMERYDPDVGKYSVEEMNHFGLLYYLSEELVGRRTLGTFAENYMPSLEEHCHSNFNIPKLNEWLKYEKDQPIEAAKPTELEVNDQLIEAMIPIELIESDIALEAVIPNLEPLTPMPQCNATIVAKKTFSRAPAELHKFMSPSVPGENPSQFINSSVLEENPSQFMNSSVLEENSSQTVSLSVPEENFSQTVSLSVPEENFSQTVNPVIPQKNTQELSDSPVLPTDTIKISSDQWSGFIHEHFMSGVRTTNTNIRAALNNATVMFFELNQEDANQMQQIEGVLDFVNLGLISDKTIASLNTFIHFLPSPVSRSHFLARVILDRPLYARFQLNSIQKDVLFEDLSNKIQTLLENNSSLTAEDLEKTTQQTNDLMMDFFPQVCEPSEALLPNFYSVTGSNHAVLTAQGLSDYVVKFIENQKVDLCKDPSSSELQDLSNYLAQYFGEIENEDLYFESAVTEQYDKICAFFNTNKIGLLFMSGHDISNNNRNFLSQMKPEWIRSAFAVHQINEFLTQTPACRTMSIVEKSRCYVEFTDVLSSADLSKQDTLFRQRIRKELNARLLDTNNPFLLNNKYTLESAVEYIVDSTRLASQHQWGKDNDAFLNPQDTSNKRFFESFFARCWEFVDTFKSNLINVAKERAAEERAAEERAAEERAAEERAAQKRAAEERAAEERAAQKRAAQEKVDLENSRELELIKEEDVKQKVFEEESEEPFCTFKDKPKSIKKSNFKLILESNISLIQPSNNASIRLVQEMNDSNISFLDRLKSVWDSPAGTYLPQYQKEKEQQKLINTRKECDQRLLSEQSLEPEEKQKPTKQNAKQLKRQRYKKRYKQRNLDKIKGSEIDSLHSVGDGEATLSFLTLPNTEVNKSDNIGSSFSISNHGDSDDEATLSFLKPTADTESNKSPSRDLSSFSNILMNDEGDSDNDTSLANIALLARVEKRLEQSDRNSAELQQRQKELEEKSRQEHALNLNKTKDFLEALFNTETKRQEQIEKQLEEENKAREIKYKEIQDEIADNERLINEIKQDMRQDKRNKNDGGHQNMTSLMAFDQLKNELNKIIGVSNDQKQQSQQNRKPIVFTIHRNKADVKNRAPDISYDLDEDNMQPRKLSINKQT